MIFFFFLSLYYCDVLICRGLVVAFDSSSACYDVVLSLFYYDILFL